MGEIDQIETISGQPFSKLGDEDAPKGRLFAALAFVATKRTNPAFTINEAEALTMADLGTILGSDVVDAAPGALPKVTN